MNKLQKIFYSMVFLALNFPAKAFGMAELYGTTQVMYGVPGGGWGESEVIPWYTIASRYLLFVVVPIALIIVIIVLLIRKSRKKK